MSISPDHPGLRVTCEELIAFLWAYLSGELEPERAEIFERHLEICPGCATYLETYRQAVELSRGALDEPEAEIPEELVQAVLAARRMTQPD
jgi:anti-sigma factor RsiW